MPVHVAVVGAGLMGSAAAMALARLGAAVTLYEAREFGHAAGSSHGSARIFRRAYRDPLYVRMTGEAADLWRSLESATGTPLLKVTGGLDFGSVRDPVGIAAVLAEQDVAHTLLTAGEAARRWPGFAFDGPVLFHPEAGVVDADRAVRAMITAAVTAGARAVVRTPVVKIDRRGAGARVHLAGGTTRVADVVVVAAGAWLPDLLRDVVALPPLRVTQQQAFHFPRRDPGADWPVFVYKGPDAQVYGLPAGRDGGPDGAIKMAEHDAGRTTTADGRDFAIDPASRDRLLGLLGTRFPGLRPAPFAPASCLYTSTANEDFLIDRAGPIVVCSPCSGHGAKFAPLIGEIAATLALGGQTYDPRFTLRAHAVTSMIG